MKKIWFILTVIFNNPIISFKFNSTIPTNSSLQPPTISSQTITAQLQNHWPMNNFTDVVGNANLQCGTNVLFAYDRFCDPNSAIYLNNGYLMAPPGVYFSGDFTLIAWINLKSYEAWSRIIDFANGASDDNVRLYYDNNYSLKISILSQNLPSYLQTKSLTLEIGEWYHVAIVLSKTKGFLYLNGNLIATNALNVPQNVTRKSNYIGKSNSGEPNVDAIYDDVKIYKTALTENFILGDYNISSNNGTISNNCPITTNSQTGNIKDYCREIQTGVVTSSYNIISENPGTIPGIINSTSTKILSSNIETKTPEYSSIAETKIITGIAASTKASTLSPETQIHLNALRNLNINSSETVKIICDLLQKPLDLSSCLLNCSNNGLCQSDGNSSFSCECYENFTEPACKKDMRYCSQLQCLNNGTCNDIIDRINKTFSFNCTCSYPFYGQRCENRIDLCKEKQCSRQGICKMVNKTITACQCFNGYSGDNCEIEGTKIKIIKAVRNTSAIISIVMISCFSLGIMFLDFQRFI